MEGISDTERIFKSEHIYEIRGVNRTFTLGGETVHALQNVTVDLRVAETIAIIGPSGSGKTTFLSMLGLIDYVDSGKIYFNGDRIDNLSETERDTFRMKNLGFIFQSFNLIPELSAQGNVMLPLLLSGTSWGTARRKAREMLTLLGLETKFRSYPSELSGGQQQRVAIARALAKEAFVILADEPTANLDSQNAMQLAGLLTQLAKDKKVSVVLVTHDLEIAKKADRILTLRDGKLEEADEHALSTIPYAERTEGMHQRTWVEMRRIEEKEEIKANKFVSALVIFLAVFTIVLGVVLNSFFEFIPFLAIPQVRTVFTDSLSTIQSISRTTAVQETASTESEIGARIASQKGSQIVNLYSVLMGVGASDDQVKKWLDQDYDKTALRFEFIKSKEYQDYLADVNRKEGYGDALKQLGKAVYGKEPLKDTIFQFTYGGVPLRTARLAFIRTSTYKDYLSQNNSNIRDAEIEYLFETILDKAPTSDQLRKYAGSKMFIDAIKDDLNKKANE